MKEITRSVTKNIKGQEYTYDEVYFLHYEVDEDTGMLNKNKRVRYYTSSQMDRNLETMKAVMEG